jgi:hypothetical protein
MVTSNFYNSLQKIIIFLCMCLSLKICARDSTHTNPLNHVWEGNLALPTSQQPGTFLALGQNIVDENDFLAFIQYNHLQSHHGKNRSIIPSLLYGIDDNSSLLLSIPIITDFTVDSHRSQGISDITLQYEYAYLNKIEHDHALQGTVIGNIGFPTGSARKDPPTGFGSTSFLLGTTMSYLSIRWYGFLSAGAILTTSHHCYKAGNQFLYQGGFGRNIAYKSHRWILTGIIEFDGVYDQRSKVHNKLEPNSGNNTILSSFTLWFSMQKITVIGNLSVPIMQHLFGCQNKKKYDFEVTAGWKFN